MKILNLGCGVDIKKSVIWKRYFIEGGWPVIITEKTRKEAQECFTVPIIKEEIIPESTREWINQDYVPLPGVDVVHNCNKFPYPFKKNEFDGVYAHQVLEHLSDRLKVMDELWRITKPGGRLVISTPYFTSAGAFCHPEHKSFWGYTTFDYWDVDYHAKTPNTEVFTKTRFKTIKKNIVFAESHNRLLQMMNEVLTPLININRTTALIYQKFFSWILPCENLEVVLEVVK